MRIFSLMESNNPLQDELLAYFSSDEINTITCKSKEFKELSLDPSQNGINLVVASSYELASRNGRNLVVALTKKVNPNIAVFLFVLNDGSKEYKTASKLLTPALKESVVVIELTNPTQFKSKLSEAMNLCIDTFSSLADTSMDVYIPEDNEDVEVEDSSPLKEVPLTIKERQSNRTNLRSPRTRVNKGRTSLRNIPEEKPRIKEPVSEDVYSNVPEDNEDEGLEAINELIIKDEPEVQEVPNEISTVQNLVKDLEMEDPKEKSSELKPTKTYTEELKEELEKAASIPSLDETVSNIKIARLEEELSNTSKTFISNVEDIRILEKEIKSIYTSRDLTPPEKHRRIIDLINTKTELQKSNGAALSDSVCSILGMITSTLTEISIEKESELERRRIEVAKLSKEPIFRSSEELIRKRSEVIKDIRLNLESLAGIVSNMSDLASKASEVIIEGVPTNNAIINYHLKDICPINVEDFNKFTNKLFQELTEGTITLGHVERSLKAILNNIVKEIDISNELLEAQQNMLDNVNIPEPESRVMFNSPMKHMLRVFSGISGKTVGALVSHSILNRKGDTLTIDLTEEKSSTDYIATTASLELAMTNLNPTSEYLVVDDLKHLDIESFVNFLIHIESNYRYINVITNDIEIVEKLKQYALTVYLFTFYNRKSLLEIKKFVECIKSEENVAKRLVVISDDFDIQSIVDILNIDPTLFVINKIPYISQIPNAEIRHINPGHDQGIRESYESILSI